MARESYIVCDKCGKKEDSGTARYTHVRLENGLTIGISADVCVACRDALKKFLGLTGTL
jgi:hypothetical protein